jgi:uridine kinase
MFRSQKTAKQLNRVFQEWLTSDEKLVVGIDGYAGSGKTTLADQLWVLNKDVLVVHLDDFIHHWQDRKKWMDEAKDKSRVFEYKWYRYDALEQLIKEFKSKQVGLLKMKTYDFDKNEFDSGKEFDLSKKILVVDGVFLFHPDHAVSKLLDRKVYLQIDVAKGDERRITREKRKWGKHFVEDNAAGSYVKYFKEAYMRYVDVYNPQSRADIVFEALSVDDKAE